MPCSVVVWLSSMRRFSIVTFAAVIWKTCAVLAPFTTGRVAGAPPLPRMVTDLLTITFSVYVPAATLITSPGVARFTASWIVQWYVFCVMLWTGAMTGLSMPPSQSSSMPLLQTSVAPGLTAGFASLQSVLFVT